jgi:GH15 family glucan-1,4-alpha-glucosidase
VGGILRYTGDHYRGGNPWILATLWLGSCELALGETAAARSRLEWVNGKMTEQGFLAEQVHRETGQPCWVIPLAWSHAVYLLFVRETLDRGLEKEIWGG